MRRIFATLVMTMTLAASVAAAAVASNDSHGRAAGKGQERAAEQRTTEDDRRDAAGQQRASAAATVQTDAAEVDEPRAPQRAADRATQQVTERVNEHAAEGAQAPTRNPLVAGEEATDDGSDDGSMADDDEAVTERHWLVEIEGRIVYGGDTVLDVSVRSDGETAEGRIDFDREDLKLYITVGCLFEGESGWAMSGPSTVEYGSAPAYLSFEVNAEGDRIRIREVAPSDTCGYSGYYPASITEGELEITS